MKNNYKILLIIITILLILIGGAILLYREEALNMLSVEAEISDLSSNPFLQTVKAEDALDLSVMKSPVLENLKNNVVNFDFNEICRRAGSSGCSLGSARPFDTSPGN